MSRKEVFQTVLNKFFIIVTLINVATFILGSIFRPNDTFGYGAFIYPVIYGMISSVPVLIFSKAGRQLTIKQAILRELGLLIVLECVLISFSYGLSGVERNPVEVVAFALSVFVIYVLVFVISRLLDLRQAKILTDDLLVFQERELKKMEEEKSR